jgi:quinol monooxygenase YgiN
MSVKGEKYKSMAAMKKHEKNEPMAMKMKEYGKKAVKKAVVKKMGKKK